MKVRTPLFILEFEIIFLIVFFTFLFSNEIKKVLFSFYMCYLFIIFHELAHMLVASLFGKETKTFKFCLSGVTISFKERDHLSRYKEILIYLAGPMANLLLAWIFSNHQMILEVNIGFALINLFPIYPLDGYHILYYLLEKKKQQEKIVIYISSIVLVILFIISVFVCVWCRNIEIMIFTIYIFLINKQQKKRYQYDKIHEVLRY